MPNMAALDGSVDGKEESGKCAICDIEVKDGDWALMCDLCDLWHHIECEKTSKEVYKFLMKEETNAIHWYCRKYNVIAGKIMPHISKLEKRQDRLEIRQEKKHQVIKLITCKRRWRV